MSRRVYDLHGRPADLSRAGWHLLTVLDGLTTEPKAEPVRSGTSRRGFLKWAVGTTAAAAALTVTDLEALAPQGDVKRLLWTPDEKTIFIPETEIALAEVVRTATDAETAQITGVHLLRIRDDNRITVMSEPAFDQFGHLAYAGATLEVHFDDGTIAYKHVARDGSLEDARRKAHAFRDEQIRKREERERRTRGLRQYGYYD